MIVTAAVLTCSICGEPSTDICVFCTKDACANHRCNRCKRCSDCCECDVPLSAEEAPIEHEAAPEVANVIVDPEPMQHSEPNLAAIPEEGVSEDRVPDEGAIS